MHPNPYTPALANAALPLVRSIVRDLAELEAALRDAHLRYAQEKARPLPSQAELNATSLRTRAIERDLAACRTELDHLGVDLEQGRTGVVDFPATLDGEPALLCWGPDDERVEHYHLPDEGFDARRPLPVPMHADS